jgi:poly(beta-D-mannuronate) lyase
MWIGFVIFSPQAKAADHYVATPSQLTTALAGALPGDTVTMRNGTWSDLYLRINGNHGTAAANITLRAETPGEVVLTGTSRLRIGRDYWVVDGLVFKDGALGSGMGDVIEFRDGSSRLANHSRLTNSQMLYYNPVDDTAYKWVSLFGQYNRVDHSHFEGKSNPGALLVVWRYGDTSDHEDHHRIDHNYFGKIPPLGANGAEVIRIGTSQYSRGDSFTTVDYNYFEECDGEGELISVKAGRNNIRYNTIFNSEGGIVLRHGDYSNVNGNFIFGNNYSTLSVGIRIIGEGHKIYNNYISGISGTPSSSLRGAIIVMNGDADFDEDDSDGTLLLHTYKPVRNVKIVNNTLVHNGRNILIGSGSYSVPPDQLTFANNLVYSPSGTVFVPYSTATGTIYEGNMMLGASFGLSPVPSGIDTSSDPLLGLSALNLYRPSSASPVVGAAGGTYTFVTEDMDGQSRSGAADIGADQLSAAAVVRTPLARGDVGPVWLIAPTYYADPARPYYYLEAEGYSSISGGFSDALCDVCSGGAYSHVPDGSGGAPATDVLNYRIELTTSATLYVHLLSSGIDTSSDSFNVSVNGSAYQTVATTSDGSWMWKRHATPFSLVPGLNTISIHFREDGARVDRLALSSFSAAP